MEGYSLYNSIENVIQYIEENLRSPITLDQISDHVNISKFHLNRVFHTISKVTLMHYVRDRKLSQSTFDLLKTDFKILDISQEYGFDYEQSYIRSFKGTFGISPSKFRKVKPILKIQDKLNLNIIKAIGTDGIICNPDFVIIPKFFIAGIKHKINRQNDKLFHEANARGNEFYIGKRKEITNPINSDIYIGLVEYIPDDKLHTYYMPAIQVSAPEGIPNGITCQSIPTNKYAVFKYIGLHHVRHTNVNNLYDTFNYIYGKWMPEYGYKRSALYHFERIDYKVTRNDYCELEIYIPV